MLIFFTSRHYYFFEKFKIVEKQLFKLNCSYSKVSHTLKLQPPLIIDSFPFFLFYNIIFGHVRNLLSAFHICIYMNKTEKVCL